MEPALPGFWHVLWEFQSTTEKPSVAHCSLRPEDSALFETISPGSVRHNLVSNKADLHSLGKKWSARPVVPAYQEFYDYFQTAYAAQLQTASGYWQY